MRIGIILRVLWPAAAPRFAIEETRHLRRLGHDTRLLICRESEYQFKHPGLIRDLNNVKFVTKGKSSRLSELINLPTLFFFPKGVRGKESAIDVSTLLFLSFTLSKSSYDVILCHDQFAGLSGYIASKIHGTPYVVYTHDPISSGSVLGVESKELPLRSKWAHKLACLMEREILGEASQIVTNSRKTAESIKRTLPDFRTKLKIVYPGCNPVSNPNLKRRDYVLALSRWDRGRKLSFVLDIAKKVKKARFVIAGAFTPFQFEAEFREEIKERGLTDRVKVLPNLSEERINELYSNALVTLRWGNEGFGMDVLESAANACPAILQKQLGASEIVQHGANGFVVDRLDADEFAYYILMLLNDEHLARKMGVQAWELSKEFTWEDHATALEELLTNTKA